jgi:uncharacterized membrane protein
MPASLKVVARHLCDGPWDSLPDCQHPVAWAYLARGTLYIMKPPPPTGQKPILRGGLATWDSLSDYQHPEAWAYLARGTLYIMKQPPATRQKPHFTRGGVSIT